MRGHRLNWEPGQRGRGFIFGGDVHTWPTVGEDGEPTHDDYLYELGINDLPDYSRLHPFRISAEGLVGFTEPSTSAAARVTMADHRLRVTGRTYSHVDAMGGG